MIYTATYRINRERDKFRTYPVYASDAMDATKQALHIGAQKKMHLVGIMRGFESRLEGGFKGGQA